MKKALSFFASFVFMMCGCSSRSATADSSDAAALSVTEAEENIKKEQSFTADDLAVLQDFILGRRTDGNGRDLDVNGDGVWDSFDLALMQRRLAKAPMQSSSNVLVAYFSCTNNTAGIAGYIIDHLDADSYVIVPEVPYTEDDLKYYTDCRADREQNDPTARPEISGSIDISGYDTIFVGYPIWHGQAPKIMYTFMENSDFSGKTVIPFCTSASSPLGTSAKNLSACAPDANWFEGKRFSGSASEEEVTEWVDSLEISSKSEENVMYITIGETKLSATLADNPSAQALKELLKKSPLTVNMSDYGDFEKVGSIGTTLPRSDEKITTEPGDIILYQGTSITIYYDTNTWDFTRLGKINGVTQEELKAILGDGDVTVTFSLE